MEENLKLPKKYDLPRMILLILGAVILLELGYAAWVLSKPAQKTYQSSSSKESLTGGKIILTAPKKNYQVGDSLSVTIGVTTGASSTQGTDVVINFDPLVLEATGGAFEKGEFYPEYSPLNLDSKMGTIQVSGLRGVNQKEVYGTGVFGKVNFKIKQPGETQIKLDFTPGLTNDSNIIDAKEGEDILEKVFNLDLDISK